MRKFLIIGVCIAGFAILAATHAKKCDHRESEKSHKCECFPKWMKETKIEIDSVEDGAIIKITSDKPEIVRKIQEWARKCGECWKRGKCSSEEVKKSEKVKDPVCGMEVDKEKALKAEYEGKTYYFCAQHCKDSFLKEPEKYIKKR